METEENQKEKNEEFKEAMTKNELIRFAYDIGFSISIPIVIFVLGGRIIDKTYSTAPLFMIIGLLISIISTSYLIYKKVKKML